MPNASLPPLGALRAFEAAARLESVTQAAGELHVTHGAVSRQIRALEEALGQPLFERAGRGLVLTAAGARLRDATGAALTQLQQTWTSLRRADRGDALVLGCSASVLARWVIPRLERMQAALPGVRLHFSAQESPELQPGVDAMLLLGQAPWPADWQVHALGGEEIGPIVSPRYPGLPGLLDQPARALSGERLLHTTSRPQAWPQWAQQHTLAAEDLHYGEGFPHLYYLLEAAASGLGVAIAPRQLVAEDLASGRLLAPWGFTRTSGNWVLCAPRRAADARLTALAEWLRAELSSPPSPA
ncbi:LysR family transcriptional regulator [Pseudoxanthomonas sp.]|uniref:LysR family transcriptional regulator n=1 Tax=Pseudoxanthomonas sp. TaxID=1871049 RepID=UPI002605D10F|nr:LysR family transcriptional regulator [Pseudoxanthomonas sp.]WDS36469.1 MAG: LysR family transcriptional regulator [Pseudoxanthomonas sp.]